MIAVIFFYLLDEYEQLNKINEVVRFFKFCVCNCNSSIWRYKTTTYTFIAFLLVLHLHYFFLNKQYCSLFHGSISKEQKTVNEKCVKVYFKMLLFWDCRHLIYSWQDKIIKLNRFPNSLCLVPRCIHSTTSSTKIISSCYQILA